MMSKVLRKNILLYKLFSFFEDFSFFVPIFVIFLESHQLSLAQIMTLQSIYVLSVLLLELPTGVLADKYGRKNTMILGSVFGALGLMLFGAGSSFVLFVFAMLIFSLCSSLYSGAGEAFLYDSLKDEQNEQKFDGLVAAANGYRIFGTTVAFICGGLIAEYSLQVPFFASAIIYMLLCLPVGLMQEPRSSCSTADVTTIPLKALQTVRLNKRILWGMSFFAFVSTAVWGSYFLYQPLFQEMQVPVFYFGFVYAAFNISAFVVSVKYLDIVKWFRGSQFVFFMIACILTPLLVIANFLWLPLVVLFCLHHIARGVAYPFVSNIINQAVSSDQRATVLSINSMLSRGIQFLFFPIIGYGADIFGIQITFLIIFSVLVVVSIPLIVTRRFARY